MTAFQPADPDGTGDLCANCGRIFDQHAEADVHGSLECPPRGVGRAPAGYRQFIPPRPQPLLLHLVPAAEGRSLRTLCGRTVREDWYEPPYTQRSKCRRCWLARAERERGS